MFRSSIAVLVSLTISSSASAQDVFDVEAVLRGDGDGLTSEAVVAGATDRAPSLAAANAAITRVETSTQVVWAAILPNLSVGARYTRLSGIDNDPLVSGPDGRGGPTLPVIQNQLGFDVGVQLPVSELFLTLLPQLEAAEAAVDVERARRDVAEATLQLRVREAYYGALRARALLAVSAQHVRDAEEQARLAGVGHDEGVVLRSDVLGAEAQLAQSRATRESAAAMLEAADATLRALLGLAPDAPIAIAEDLSVPLPRQRRGLATLVALSFERRAETRVIRHGIHASRRIRAAAEGAQWPTLRVGFGAQFANPNPRYTPQRQSFDATWNLGVTLSWSPNRSMVAVARARAAEADASRLEADLAAFGDALHQQVAGAHAEDRSARARLSAARAAVEAASESFLARFAERGAGESRTSEVLDAQLDLAQARMLWVESAVAARTARARLAFATADAVEAP